jgi:dipeptidase D
MTGAINLKPDFFSGRTLLNLDSEDEGILFIGCAGGMDTVGNMKFNIVPVKNGSCALKISVTGLHGGHSGDEIHKGYGNSVKIITRLLLNISEKFEISIAGFDGGNLKNAIPREAFAIIVTEESNKKAIKTWFEIFQTTLNNEFGDLEKNLRIFTSEVDLPDFVMDKTTQEKLINVLTCCPHGVIAWSKDMDDLVETSTNLASAKFTEKQTVRIVTTQRSSVESSKHYVASMVESCMKLSGTEVTHSEGYPGWKPDLKSEILGITRKSYHKLFGKEPMVKAIHAGLECGLLYEKIKGIDMISFGPTIRGAHTPEEKIEIKTVQMFWDLLTEVIRNMPVK